MITNNFMINPGFTKYRLLPTTKEVMFVFNDNDNDFIAYCSTIET